MSRGQGRVYRPKVRGQQTAVWWMDYGVRGQRHRESAHTTSKTEAQQQLRERMAGRESGRLVGTPDRVTFEDLRELVVRQYGLDGRRSVWRIQLAFDHLATVFAGRRAADINASSADAYAAARLAEGAARATVNRELAALRRGFRLAVKKGLLATRPEFEIPKEDNVRTGFFEDEDFQVLLAQLPAYLKPIARFAYRTGWRIKSEVLPLTWAHVDREAGVVVLDVGATKSGEGRVFPFSAHPDLAALLEEQWAARDGLYVFHHRGARIRDFYEAWHSACRRAAVQHVNGREVIVRPELVDRIPHDFRRTAVRNLVRAGVPERVAMQLTGHKTRAVFDRYNIVNERDLTEGVARLALANGKQAANNPAPGRGRHALSSGAA